MSRAPAIKTATPTDVGAFAPVISGLDDRALFNHFRNRTTPRIPCHVDPREVSETLLDGVIAGHFRLNGEAHALNGPIDWRRNPSADIEWLILLNKFYFAPGLAQRFAHTGDQRVADRLIELITSYIDAEIEPGFIAADVTGRRLQNWVYALAGLFASNPAPVFPRDFLRKMLLSIDEQTAWLIANLHAARNHRTLELYAILLVSLAFPELKRAPERLAFAIKALEKNALSDFRGDGGHCEQSPHYHCIVLANFLNAAALLADHGLKLSTQALERLRQASRFAALLHRPDGEIPALSDSDGGSHLDTIRKAGRLFGDEAFAERAPFCESAFFPESGYVVLRGRNDAETPRDARYLVFDCGPLGAGNHGHFDALSIEAYAFGRPLIVDPGRYTYDESGPKNWRAAFRETHAHSTVEIDGKNQTRYEQGPKRKRISGSEPRIVEPIYGERDGVRFAGATAVSAEYDAAHRRRILFVDSAFWIVIDDLSALSPHAYALRYQFAADARLSIAPATDAMSARAAIDGLSLIIFGSAPFAAAPEQRFVSRAYGRKSPAPMLRCDAIGARLRWVSVLMPWRDAPPGFSAMIEGDEAIVSHFAGDCLRDYLVEIGEGREGAVKRRAIS